MSVDFQRRLARALQQAALDGTLTIEMEVTEEEFAEIQRYVREYMSATSSDVWYPNENIKVTTITWSGFTIHFLRVTNKSKTDPAQLSLDFPPVC